MQIVKYRPAALGIGTESSSKLQPLEFSPSIVNRYYDSIGNLVKRQGMVRVGTTIMQTLGIGLEIPTPILGLHEYITASGEAILIAQGIAGNNGAGTVLPGYFVYNVSAGNWDRAQNSVPGSNIYSPPTGQQRSVQMGNKLIWYDGITFPYYQVWRGNNVVEQAQLRAVITRGVTSTGSNATTLTDADITNWRNTNVAVNDLVEISDILSGLINNPPMYGIVTSVGTTSLDITTVGSAATGIGTGDPTNKHYSNKANLPYRVLDLVELNIFPVGDVSLSAGGGPALYYDNIAVGGASTSVRAISVTSFSFNTSEIRSGDYIYNTTRGAVTQVTTVSSNIAVVSVASQTAGDSFVFMKEAMPIPSYAHVHYGRLHLIDARDPTKIRVSGPNDPEDFTTFSKTLSSITMDYGSRQPQGDKLISMSTFGRYLVVGGANNIYVTDGTSPIADVTADVIDLNPVGLFPQGLVSRDALVNNGESMLYVGYDGLRSFISSFSSNNASTFNISEQIKTRLATEMTPYLDTEGAIQLIHYPRRNWVMLKIGEKIYNYDYSNSFSNGRRERKGQYTIFTGLPAQQQKFLVRQNGNIITAGSAAGLVYQFDVSGVFKDDGANIQTTYISPWHTLQESVSDEIILNKDGRYIQPLFETSAAIKYNISVVGDYNEIATDSVIVTANASGATFPKVPLRWRGRQAQITITTDTSATSADIINSYTIYGNVFGRK